MFWYYLGLILLGLSVLAIITIFYFVARSRAYDALDDTTIDEISKDKDYEAWLKRQGII